MIDDPSAVRERAAIRVVIADDHAIVREGLRALVDNQEGLEVVGEADDGQHAWRLARELQPDVLLLDVSMPGVGGVEAAERIAHDCPRVRVIALTMHEEHGYVSRLLRAGAAGYLLKHTATSELVRAIRVVVSGGRYVDPSLAGSLLAGRNASAASAPRAGVELSALSVREVEVLRLVALGHSNKEVAGALEISIKTVETHKANAMVKLGLRNRVALVRFAVAEGWLSE